MKQAEYLEERGIIILYDPTIYENLKVALENQLYDLDNLDHLIFVTNRKELLDTAILRRSFHIEFILPDEPEVITEIQLHAELKDLAGEILETGDGNIGCSVVLQFTKRIYDMPNQCRQIDQQLRTVWDSEISIKQTLSFIYGKSITSYKNVIELQADEKINESHIKKLPEFLHYVLKTKRLLRNI